MLNRLFVVGAATLIWGGLFGLSLSISNLDLGHFKSLCGAWGCLPPVAPLLSVHAMWLTLLGGFAWFSWLTFPILQDWRPWLSILVTSILVVTVLLGLETRSYFDAGGSLQGMDWIKYPVFKVVAWTDYPLIQIAFCAIPNIFAGLRPSPRSNAKNGNWTRREETNLGPSHISQDA